MKEPSNLKKHDSVESFKILQINIRSIYANFDELCNTVHKLNIDIKHGLKITNYQKTSSITLLLV